MIHESQDEVRDAHHATGERLKDKNTPAEPVYLDMKPGPLTNRERELFQRRLGIVREELAYDGR